MKVLSWFLNLLYPPKCVICSRLLKEHETDLCQKCRKNLPEAEGEFKRGEFYSKCRAVVYYENAVAESIRRFKFHGMRHYAASYGALLAMKLQRERVTFDVLTWVPTGKDRQRVRGYDQSYLLAKSVADALKVPCVSTLQKVRQNPAQSGMSDVAARRANVLGAYQGQKGIDLRKKRVLLIDDVMTSGATLSECSRVLLMEGAAEVQCATFAVTREKTKLQ